MLYPSAGQRQSDIEHMRNQVPIGNGNAVECSVVPTWPLVAIGLSGHAKRVGPSTAGRSDDVQCNMRSNSALARRNSPEARRRGKLKFGVHF